MESRAARTDRGRDEILRNREEIAAEERDRLQPFATLSSESRGRRKDETPDPRRTDFQRDRDRIIHSTAFRRLIGKTQVFVSDTGDHYRVRLTHSLEVAQVARSISRTLGLNEDLTEALALAHDLGHTPFGHSGGEVLDELMADHGGFEHNRQSLRVLDHLEVRYPDVRGLNLTYEVRESIIKHKRPFEGPDYAPYHPEEGPALEAQVVDQADGIAYNSADLDDGLRAGILDPGDLQGVPLWRRVEQETLERFPGLSGRLLQHKAVAQLISLLVEDLLASTRDEITRRGIRTLADVRAQTEPLVVFSPEVRALELELRAHLHEKFYTHYKVCRMRYRAEVLISGLFNAYRNSTELLPPRFQELADEDGAERAIADYISGMTDGYAQKEYSLLFHPGQGSLDP